MIRRILTVKVPINSSLPRSSSKHSTKIAPFSISPPHKVLIETVIGFQVGSRVFLMISVLAIATGFVLGPVLGREN